MQVAYALMSPSIIFFLSLKQISGTDIVQVSLPFRDLPQEAKYLSQHDNIHTPCDQLVSMIPLRRRKLRVGFDPRSARYPWKNGVSSLSCSLPEKQRALV
jgi:hypothetical protein